MPVPLQAALWGLLSGSALVLGAAIAYIVRVPPHTLAAIMAFGSGVLISALSFQLMDEGYRIGGLWALAAGFLLGAAMYTFVNYVIAHRGGRHRKRSGKQQGGADSNGTAIAVGALLDGIPESIAIGVSLLGGPGVSVPAVVAVFLSNLPEGLSSASGMRNAGKSPRHVFTLWGAIALASALAALIGNVALTGTSPLVIAFVNALAAGAILAMLADTMIPEAFEIAHDFAGLVTVAGFLVAFVLTKVG